MLRTDHNSLRWLHNFQGLEEQLANFQYKIVHRPGKLHANADAPSRLPAFCSFGAQGHGSPASQNVDRDTLKVCAVQETLELSPTEGGDIDELTKPR